MSVVMTMSILVEEQSLKIRNQIVNFFEKGKIKLDNSDDIEISVTFKDDKNYCLYIEGEQHWELWQLNKDDFAKKFKSNYFTISYIEGDAIYIDLRLDDIIINELKFSPGRFRKQFFEILESEHFLQDVKNWAIKQINKKYKRNFELDDIQETTDSCLEVTEELEKEIYRIIKHDNSTDFEKLLSNGLSLNHQFKGFEIDLDAYCKTIGDAIIAMNAIKIAHLIFTHDRVDEIVFLTTPIYSAATDNYVEMINLLIDVGYSPNKKDNGHTALLLTVFNGYYEACETLLKSGKCNPKLVDSHPRSLDEYANQTETSAIGEAARQGRLDIVKLLLKYKVDKQQMIRATIVACKNGFEEVSLEILGKLDEKRKKGDIANYPLNAIFYAIENNLNRVTEHLFDLDPQVVNYIDDYRTPLSSACKVNNIPLVKRLISLGVDIHGFDRSKYVLYNNKKLLVADTQEAQDIKYEHPTHPLAVAAAHGYLELVKLFIELGVDSRIAVLRENTAGFAGYSMLHDVPALELAEANGHKDVIKYLHGIEKDLPVKRPIL